MATVALVGEPVNDAERLAIARLRVHSPDNRSICDAFDVSCDGARIRGNGHSVVRALWRKVKTDDDLPRIAEAYRGFRAELSGPGA